MATSASKIDLQRRVLTFGMVTAIVGGASAQTSAIPTAPNKVVFPFLAGGTGGVVARMVGERLAAELGQPVIVDNRKGAGGAIGA